MKQMNPAAMVAINAKKAQKQKGVTILQVLIGTIVSAIALVASISAIQGQRTDSEQAETVAFATSELYPVLAAQFANGGRSYAPFGTACGNKGTIALQNTSITNSCAETLVKQKGLREKLPSGADWSVASNTATQFVVNLGCNDTGSCALLKAAIDGAATKINPAASRPTAAATTAAPFQVVVTYPAPL